MGASALALLWALTHSRATASVAAVYLMYAFVVDGSSTSGAHASPWLRSLRWWRDYADYFPLTLIKTAALDPSKTYVFAYHPHGIISVGAFGSFAADGARVLDLTRPATDGPDPRRGFTQLFPGISPRLVTLPINMAVPIAREYPLMLGCVNSNTAAFRRVLGRGAGSALAVVVGGAEESTMTEEHAMGRLVLDKRKGFVREAIKAGAHLVPVLAFGENDLYHTVQLHPKSSRRDALIVSAQQLIKRVAGFTVPLFRGRSILFKDVGLMPHRVPINVVCGAPIAPPHLDAERRKSFSPKYDRSKDGAPLNDDARLVDAQHHVYVQALLALYEAHKDAEWNQPGLEREESLKIAK